MTEYTVIYPGVQYDNPFNDQATINYGKQRQVTKLTVPGRTDHDTLERIFAGMNGGSGSEFPWFLKERMRSLSVGDVVALYKPALIGSKWFICDSCGWLEVNATQAQSWLDFPRKHGCDTFELRQWQKTQNFPEAS